jgi:chemosensory pili system protein ChpA (sensor histidine kinase/response regulator)
MGHDHLQTFSDEAGNILSGIRSSLLIHLQHDAVDVDLGMPDRLAGSLKNICSTQGSDNIEKLSDDLAKQLQNLVDLGRGPTAEQVRGLLDHLILIEAAVAEINAGPADSKFDITAFVDESFDTLRVGPVPKKTSNGNGRIAEPEPEFEAFEADAEMLEIFQQEADELLRNIETNLDLLARQPKNENALWEIRRYAHTFKGAAGIIGLKRLSHLAHRVEDLLDTLAENNAGPNERIFSVLMTAFDCLKALANGESSSELDERIADVYGNFDGVLKTLETTPSESVADVASTRPSEPNVDAKTAQNRPIVRVALSRLDSLVEIVRNLVATRSALEQRLSEFERQIDDLHNSNRRLQSTRAKLESDFHLDGGHAVPSATAFSTDRFRDVSQEPIRVPYFPIEFNQSTHDLGETARDTLVIESSLDAIRSGLESLFDNQRLLAEEIQSRLMQLRMIEFGTLTNRLLRTVRVTCDEENKKADLSIENGQLEIDTQILDWLVEPLMHLLKNSVAHGIESPDTRRLLGKPETGTIVLKISNDDTHIHLSINDDGRGIGTSALKEKAVSNGLISETEASAMNDDDLLDLIFLPGLTTAERLSLSAGRGVGMSIVKESVEARKGIISVRSIPQRGTTFNILVPLPVASTRVLVVKAGHQTLAIPINLIKHIGEIGLEHIKHDGPRATVELGAGRFQFHFLGDLLGHAGPERGHVNAVVLMIESDSKNYVVAVDSVINTEDATIEPSADPLDASNGLMGAAILGTGDIVPVIDLPKLLETKKPAQRSNTVQLDPPEEFIVMIVDDSPSVRQMTSKVIESAGWTTETAKDGIDAIEKLRTCRTLPSVILSDIEMPRMDGYEFAAAIRENADLNKIPVIFISSRTGEGHREKAFASGAAEVLVKPYDNQELISVIESLTKLQLV